MGDQLGVNFWTAKSKYGATIQTALDYAIAQNVNSEDVDDIVPHVASIAAAYGDPKGKYKAFLQSKMSNYQNEAWWFYDQTAALPNSPAAGKVKRAEGSAKHGDGEKDDAAPVPHIDFECPAVFKDTPRVELEDGLFVTCDELKPLYEIAPNPDIIGSEYVY